MVSLVSAGLVDGFTASSELLISAWLAGGGSVPLAFHLPLGTSEFAIACCSRGDNEGELEQIET